MSYSFSFLPSCEKELTKHVKKNPSLKKAVYKKIKEIILDPYHYKPLRNKLAGERRVHIFKSYVLKFKIDEENNNVVFIFFGHHDVAYKR